MKILNAPHCEDDMPKIELNAVALDASELSVEEFERDEGVTRRALCSLAVQGYLIEMGEQGFTLQSVTTPQTPEPRTSTHTERTDP